LLFFLSCCSVTCLKKFCRNKGRHPPPPPPPTSAANHPSSPIPPATTAIIDKRSSPPSASCVILPSLPLPSSRREGGALSSPAATFVGRCRACIAGEAVWRQCKNDDINDDIDDDINTDDDDIDAMWGGNG
jgi:hypothetical protein